MPTQSFSEKTARNLVTEADIGLLRYFNLLHGRVKKRFIGPSSKNAKLVKFLRSGKERLQAPKFLKFIDKLFCDNWKDTAI